MMVDGALKELIDLRFSELEKRLLMQWESHYQADVKLVQAWTSRFDQIDRRQELIYEKIESLEQTRIYTRAWFAGLLFAGGSFAAVVTILVQHLLR